MGHGACSSWSSFPGPPPPNSLVYWGRNEEKEMTCDLIDPCRSSLFVGCHFFSAQPLRSSMRCVQMLALLRHLRASSLKCPLGPSPLLSRMMREIWLQVGLFPYCSHQCHLFGFPCPEKQAPYVLTTPTSGTLPCHGMPRPSFPHPATSLQLSCSLQRKAQHCPLDWISNPNSLLPHHLNSSFLLENGMVKGWVGGPGWQDCLGVS